MADDITARFFALFNEIGILGQLSSTLLEARLPEGLLTSHFTVLNHLVRIGDGPTPLALARAFQVPKTTMTHTLSVLARHGLVEMRPNPKDGRSKCVWITPAGRDLRAGTIAAMGPDVAALSERFAPDRVGALLPELGDLRRIMDEMRDAPEPSDAVAANAPPRGRI